MTHESFIAFCKEMPASQPDFPFGENVMTWKVKGKIFAMISILPEEWYVLKCNPERSTQLREEWMEIEPAWHCNKKHWIQLDLSGLLPDSLIIDLIRHSYEEVVKKLPKKTQRKTEDEKIKVYQDITSMFLYCTNRTTYASLSHGYFVYLNLSHKTNNHE